MVRQTHEVGLPQTPSKHTTNNTEEDIFSTPKMGDNRRSTLFSVVGWEQEDEVQTELQTENPYSMEDFEAQYTSDSDELYRSVLRLLHDKDAMKTEIEQWQIALEDGQAEKDQLEQKVAQLESQNNNDNTHADLAETIRKMKTAQAELILSKDLQSSYSNQIAQLVEDLDKYKKKVTADDKQLGKLKDKLADVQQNNVAIQSLLEEELAKDNTPAVDVDALLARSQDLEKQVELLNRKLAIVLSSRGLRLPTPNDDEETSSQLSSRVSNNPRQHRPKEPNIKDPESLKDGKFPISFENWEKAILTSFALRTQTLQSQAARMGYIWTLTGGAAQERLSAKYMASEDAYTTAEQMLLDLRNAFVDPNKQGNAKEEYRRLKQGDAEFFNTFELRFHRLATDSKLAPSNWREELLEKINVTLQMECITTRDNCTTYEQLKSHLEIIDQRLRLVRSHQRNSKTTYPSATPKPNPTSLSQYSGGKKVDFAVKSALKTTTNTKRSPPEPKDVASGVCFNCHLDGHYARDCPDLKTTLAMMDGAEVYEFLMKAKEHEKGGEEADSESDSGNAST